MKPLTDRVSEFTFDARVLQGFRTRILLGATLGAVVPQVFDVGAKRAIDVEPKVVAFLSGLAVKVVYGVLENLIDALPQRFNLGSVRRAAKDRAPVVVSAATTSSSADTAIGTTGMAAPERCTPVREIKSLLVGLGLYRGVPNSSLDPDTMDAIRRFLGADSAFDIKGA